VIDKLEIVRQFLLVSGTPLLTALGGNYVAVNRVPAAFQNTHPAIILIQETGGGHVTGADFTDTIICRCYGGSALDSDARAIFRALYDRLLLPGQTAVTAGKLKQAFYLDDNPGPDDPDEGWPNHIGRFRVALEA
jgi:hypothetical protein